MKTHALKQSEVPLWLAGATELRVVVKPQPDAIGPLVTGLYGDLVETRDVPFLLGFHCPYPVGSELALTETWCRTGAGFTIYKADNKREQPYWSMLTWHSPATMPAEFSRFHRRVAGVRVEHDSEWTWALTLEVNHG
jgi:hypothetical protein